VRWLAFAAVLAVACDAPDRGPRWRPSSTTTPHVGGTLRFAAQDNIRTLDPAIAYDEISSYVLHPVLDTLVDYAPASTRLVPRLAARWTISPDGLSYRFELRDDIAYADGRPIVAADFVYSLERVKKIDSPFASYLVDVASLAAPDPRTLEIRLQRPSASFLAILAMPFAAPLRADHVEAAGDRIRRQPLASGPYELVEWREGERIVLRRRPHYHDPTRQRIDEIVMLENVPRDTQFLMFERGDLDVIDKLSSPDYLYVIASEGWRPYVHTQATMTAFGSRMNVTAGPFRDRRVRQAFNYAVDKSHIVKLLNGGAVPCHGLLPPGIAGRDDALAPYPHDPAKARALLAEAGYPDGLSVTYTTTGDDEALTLAASLQSDLADVGVDMRISVLAWATYVTTIGKRDGAPFSLGSWSGDFADPVAFFDPRFHSRAISDENSINDTFYANPELDALLDAARGDPDPARRAASYRRAERILYDDAPWIWGYHRLSTEITQPYVRDYTPHPVWARDYTSAWLDVDGDGKPAAR
jgi:ABC-type transport system substrate-binding protein